jgi:Vacuolar sorting-associated protein 13, N-terminal/N-terminal region of Chorein or VPS13
MENKGRKGTLNDLIAKFVATKINQYLGKYLNNIQKEDLQASIGKSSAITLHNIKLREDAFDELGLPIEVHPSSQVQEINCVVKMLPVQVIINVKGIRITIMPSFKPWSQDQWRNYKTKSLEEWEETQKHLFENLNLKNYKRKKISVVANNINVTIEDIIICYYDTLAIGSPCVIRIHVEDLKVSTTTNDFTKEKPSNSTETTWRKAILKNFSLAVYSENTEPGKSVSMDAIRFSERMYVIKPCTITFLHTMNHIPVDKQPMHNLEIEMPSLIISLNETQKQFLESLNVLFANKQQFRVYEEYRPKSDVYGGEQDWWNYLIKSAKQDLDINIAGLVKNKHNMDRYIDCYKSCQEIIHAPWLSDKTSEKENFIAEIEDIYPLEKIIWFRTLSLYQLRIEAMSYVKARGNVRGKTHLGDLWDYYLNDFESLLGDPYKTVAEEYEIELSTEEKDELNCLLNMDELMIVDSYLNGSSSSRGDKILGISINLSQFTFFLQDTSNYSKIDIKSDYKYPDCECYRCINLQETSQSVDSGSEKESPEAEEMKGVINDAVFSIGILNKEGRACDPKLVKENTLLVVEAKLSGKLMVHRDLHIETIEDINIAHLDIWDPLTLQEKHQTEAFAEKYKFKTNNDLVSMILHGKGQDFNLMNSLRFFMQENNLEPEMEFIMHYDDNIFSKVRHFCACNMNLTTLEAKKKMFLEPNTKYCLHLPVSQVAQYKDLKQLYLSIYEYINDRVMPNYIKTCTRWIISNSVRNSISKHAIKINLKIKGKSSPLEVQFVHKKKRKLEETKSSDRIDKTVIEVESDTIKAKISTETIQLLITWLMRSQETFPYKKTFIKTLTSYSPKLDYIKSIIQNTKKHGQQLYYIIKDKQKKSDNSDVMVSISQLEVVLVETIFTDRRRNCIVSSVNINDLRVSISSDLGLNPKNATSRMDFQRDSKFYRKTETRIGSLFIETHKVHILKIYSLHFDTKNCVMAGHPYLAEKITDINIKHLNFSIGKETLTLLGLMSSLSFTPIKYCSKETFTKNQLQKKIYECDIKNMTKKLLWYQDQHYERKKLKKCLHCMLAYRKVCSNTNFSIGDMNENKSGVKLKFYAVNPNDKCLIIKSARVLGVVEEKVFNSALTVYSARFERNENLNIEINKNKRQSFDSFDVSPLFPAMAHVATPYIVSLAGCFAEKAEPLYLVMKMRNRKDYKIFDENLWKIRTKHFQSHIVNLSNNSMESRIPKAISANEDNIKQLFSHRDVHIDSDYIKVQLHKIELYGFESLNNSDLVSVLFLNVSLMNLYSKYLSSIQAKRKTKKIAPNLMKTEILLDKIFFKSEFNSQALETTIKNIKILKYPNFFSLKSLKRHTKVSKKEFIEDKSVISIENIKISVCKTGIFYVNQIKILMTKSYHQIRLSNLMKKEIFCKIIEEVNSTNLKIKFIMLRATRSRSKVNLFVMPGVYDDANLLVQSPDDIAFELGYYTKIREAGESNFLKVLLSPIGIYLKANRFTRILKSFYSLFDVNSVHNPADLLNIPKTYVFFDNPKPENKFLRVDINLSKARVDLILKNEVVSRIKINKVNINNSKDPEKYEGIVKVLEILSDNQLYPANLLPIKRRSDFQINFVYSSNLLAINISNAKVFIIMKFIEANISLVRYIVSKIPATPKAESSTKESQLQVQVALKNMLIILPKSSTDLETISINLSKAVLKTSNAEIQWKGANKSQVIEIYDKEISLETAESFETVKCLKLLIETEFAEMAHGDHKIAHAAQAQIDVLVPQDSSRGLYVLKNKIVVELHGTQLFVSLARIAQLENIINGNFDEPGIGKEKVFKTSNTKFKFKISSGKLGLARWVTKPVPEKIDTEVQEKMENVNENNFETKLDDNMHPILEATTGITNGNIIGDLYNLSPDNSIDNQDQSDEILLKTEVNVKKLLKRPSLQ